MAMKNTSLKKLWLIRHAEAVEADEFSGSDLERPLTSKGKKSAKTAFNKLAKLRKSPGFVISSKAVRARETAEIFCRAFGVKTFKESELLNPGCSFNDIKRVIKSIPANIEFAALVGHEPDFSDTVSRLASGGTLSLVLKKGAVAELEINKSGLVNLTMVIAPDLME